MRESLGCAGTFAAIAFVFGLLGSLFATGASVGVRLSLAGMFAAIVFLALLILIGKDQLRYTMAMKAVRRKLLAREARNDDDFPARFPDVDPTLLAQTCEGIARFFDVPIESIRAADDLHRDFRFGAFEPSLHAFVVFHVCEARNVWPEPFRFDTRNLNDIGDLAREVQRVLDENVTSIEEAQRKSDQSASPP